MGGGDGPGSGTGCSRSLPAQSSPMVLGEQVCAEGTWLCCTGNLGRWGRTSGLMEQEDLKVGEWKMQWDGHHQSQE